MLCEDIMSRELECVSPDDPAETAARLMRDENVGFLPVCDRSMRILGVVTDRDLALRVVAESRTASTPVKDLMTRDVLACKPRDDIRRAEELMGTHQKSRIMCVDDAGCLVGVISLADIVQSDDEGPAQETMRRISSREART
jgi:CBS domain-containing protein